MSEETIPKILSNTRSLRAFMRRMTLEDIDTMVSKIQLVRSELYDEKVKEQNEVAEKSQLINQLIQEMQDAGLSIEDINARISLMSSGNKRGAKPGVKIEPKYSIVVNGETILWTGRGRAPIAFKQYVNNGGKLHDLLIKNAEKY